MGHPDALSARRVMTEMGISQNARLKAKVAPLLR
jgi:hypothetical protein